MSKQQKIDELTKKLSELKEQRNKINAEAKGPAEKRDTLNERFKHTRTEILALKQERDESNDQVKELKKKRSNAKTKIREKVEEAKSLNQEIKTWAMRKPSKSFRALKKEVDDIDWKIQTMSPSLQEEKELVEHVKQLENQLSIYRKLAQLSQELLEVRAEIKTLETKGKDYHAKLTEIAQKSQTVHEKMLEKIEESKRLKAEADNLHKLFLETKTKAQPVQEEIDRVSRQIKLLRAEVLAEEDAEKKKKQSTLREKLENEARKKLKRGEKLTWEEFQLLGDNDETAQD